MLFVRSFVVFFIYWVLLLLNVCSVTNANQRNRNNNHHTNRIASNKNIITRRKRSLQSTFTSKITASGGHDNFGGAVSISNNRIVVGATGYNNAVYLFMDPNNPESGRSYSPMAILTVSDGQFGACFGWSVDIDGDTIVVGEFDDTFGGNGAVYVFRILSDSNNYYVSQVAKLMAQNGAADDGFGYSVAIHGDLILVGAQGVDKNGMSDVGSAYLFGNRSNDPNTPDWTQILQFQPNDLTIIDKFGVSVTVDDQIAVIGTNDYDANAAYVFAPVDGSVDVLSSWTQMAKLTGPTDSLFGYSVAVAGNSIVVSAPEYVKNNGEKTGAVFVFTKMEGSSSSSSSWTQTNILLASDGAEDDNFGISIAISKNASTIVVGADSADSSGAAYLFRNSTATTTTTVGWTQVGKHMAADGDYLDKLGASVAVENSIVLVGAPGDDTARGQDACSVYILDTENSSSPLPPTTTTPIQTTTAPTAKPVEPTFQPTPSSTTKKTNPPITNPPTTIAPSPNKGNGGNTSSSPPVTSTPKTNEPILSTLKPTTPNDTSSSSSSPNDSTTKSDNNNNIIIAAMVVFGVVILGLGIAFFNYRLRVKREDRLRLEQQQQQQIMPPSLSPLSTGNNGMAAVHADEMPVIADVIFPNPIQPTEDRTMDAEVLVPPLPTPAPPSAAVVGNIDIIDAEKGLPRYKDQAQSTAPLAGPSRTKPPPPSEPIWNHQRNGEQEELPETRYVQQQRHQQLCDPPAFAKEEKIMI